MSRLTDLIARTKVKDAALGQELEAEFKILSAHRAFGLNFERHRPENVELPGRIIRKGDKVRILETRGSTKKGDQRLWRVKKIQKTGDISVANLELLHTETPEQTDASIDDLIAISEFKDYIYPGLVSTGKVTNGGDNPFHTVINGENFHALKALTYTHRGMLDAVYIDPPYNTGARDWKYNNDYVERDDQYRHSKWLAFIERRLKVAKILLNPAASVLVCTIDEKEVLRLGLLLEQIFPDARISMISSLINAKGIIRENEFSRTNEYLFCVLIGGIRLIPHLESEIKKVRWASLRRSDIDSARGTPKGGPEQFYPLYIEPKTGKIIKVGDPLASNESVDSVPSIEGCITVLPIRENGAVREMNWGLTGATLLKRLEQGYVKALFSGQNKQKVTIYYLTSGQIQDIEDGSLIINSRDENGVANVEYSEGKPSNPTTHWAKSSHNAQSHGTDLLKSFVPNRAFPFPKSLYSVEDVLRYFIGENKHALVLDFFAGSGTTAHAVMRLNKQDGGQRQCISITNNEVGADEQKSLREKGLRPGDVDWEKWGICDYITKPRIKATITGQTPEGVPVEGDYKFTDEFPMAEGFKENAEFFTLTYETPVAISHNISFSKIAPLLWMRAGSQGERIDEVPKDGWAVLNCYGLIFDLDKAGVFAVAIAQKPSVKIAYVFTDDDRRFQSIVKQLPNGVEPVRLYESYLSNFQFSTER